MNSSSFVSDDSVDSGGAIYLETNSQLLISFSEFLSNIAGASAGAVHCASASTAAIAHSKFEYNKALQAAGALNVFEDSVLDLRDSFFAHNRGDVGGAVVLATRSSGMFVGVQMRNNLAQSYGGACYVADMCEAQFDDIVRPIPTKPLPKAVFPISRTRM